MAEARGKDNPKASKKNTDDQATSREQQEEQDRAELNANDIETLPPPTHRAD